MNRGLLYFTLCCFIFLLSCESKKNSSPDQFAFLGHIYKFHGNGGQVDKRIEALDLNNYTGIWLGGDVCTETSLTKENLQYLDQLFDLSAPSTLWALGNHDIRNGNLHWIKAATEKESFYAHWQDGFTVLVLNSNIPSTDCDQLERQFRFIETVCDSLEKSSHLVLLHHHAVWGDIEGLPKKFGTLAHGNYKHYRWHCRSESNRFSSSVYPLLRLVNKKGIQVYCISGDAGNANVKGQHHYSVDGIEFLTSGIGNSEYSNNPKKLSNAVQDQILIFSYDKNNSKMTWAYEELSRLN